MSRLLLRRERDFALLFAASAISRAGSTLAVLALALDVYARTGSPSWVGAVMLVEFAPMVVIGLFLGFLVDRIPRKRVLVGADLARALLFGGLVLAPNALTIVLLALVAAIATSFFEPASFAVTPRLVAEEDLPAANGLMQVAQWFTGPVAPFVGAALVVASGARTVYAINAVSFVISALLLWRIKRSLEDAREPGVAERFDVRRSLALVRSTAELRIVVVCWSVALLGMGLMEVSQIVLVKRSFGAGSLGYGLTNAALALGLVCGGWRVGAWTAGRSIPHAYGVSILILGGAVAAVGGIPNVWLALPLLAIGGGANAVALSCQRTLVQRSTSDAQRGRAIGIVMAFGNAAFAGSMAAAGPLTSAFGARAVWELSAALFLGASLLVFRLARTVPERRASERPVPLVEGA